MKDTIIEKLRVEISNAWITGFYRNKIELLGYIKECPYFIERIPESTILKIIEEEIRK